MKKAHLMAGLAMAMASSASDNYVHLIENTPKFDDLGYNSKSSGYVSPIFIPKKHTKMSYAKQNRLAKKRRNRSMYAGK